MQRRILIAVILAGLLETSGVRAQDRYTSANFELLHIWRVPIEQYALAAFSDPMEQMGVRWEEHEVGSNFKGVQDEFADRLALKIPPTGVFWIGGETLHPLVEDGTFRKIKPLDSDFDFSEMLKPEIYEILKHEDGISALPVGLHILNFTVYNKAIFNELGLKLPNSWDELIDSATHIKKSGRIPLSMSDELWQLRNLFNSILAEKLTARELRSLVIGKDLETIRPRLSEALETLDRLRPYVNSDNKELEWREAVEKLLRGEAAVNVLGDFTAPYFSEDERFNCSLSPGNRSVLWAFDTIALTNTQDPSQRLGQDAFIQTLTNREYLNEYVYRKGGLPVYRFKDQAQFKHCSRQSMKAWEKADERIHLGSDLWSSTLNSMAIVVQRHWRSSLQLKESVDILMDVLRNLSDDNRAR